MTVPRKQNGLEGLRLLVVEDTVIVAEEIVRLLKKFGCEAVGPVGTVPLALAAAEEHGFDGALLDVNLEGTEVFPVAEALTQHGIPFVFLTGYTREAIPAEFKGRPCLEKPFGLAEFEALLRRVFGSVPEKPKLEVRTTSANDALKPGRGGRHSARHG